MTQRRTQADRERFFRLYDEEGMSASQAATRVGISRNTANAWVKGAKDASGASLKELRKIKNLRQPLRKNELSKEALRALDDFEYFRRRYFGRISSPWQVMAAYMFLEAIASDNREYIVMNCPPGAGKSTLLHDIEAWLTCRDRALRGMLGSSTQRMALQYANRLKRTLERVIPVTGDPDEVAAGRALDAESCLAKDFGRFQTDFGDVWSQEAFIVAQLGDVAIDEKEPTWQAFGLDVKYLGTRVKIGVWDDVVTKRSMRTAEGIETQRGDWDDEAESRIEPGGALMLNGQRLGATDLYRYNLDKLATNFDDDDDEFVEPQTYIEPTGSKVPRMYKRIVFPAHDESKCTGKDEDHKRKTAKAWPDGCLLDPHRLPYKELMGHELRNPQRYRTVYQQEDTDPASVLVPKHYITGGEINGDWFPGCYDDDRALQELPKGIDLARTLSIVTVDPSPTKYWSVQWWLFNKDNELRYLLDLIRQKMSVDQFLTYDPDLRIYSGAIEDLWQLSRMRGAPFTELIMEQNGAQRFFLQSDVFKNWCRLRNVNAHRHDTTTNKSDPDYGVQTLASHYRHGRYRLPNRQNLGDMGYVIVRQLVNEITVWPEGTTDDCVMAQWFLEWWLPRLVMPELDEFPDAEVPSWLDEQDGTDMRFAMTNTNKLSNSYVADDPLQPTEV